MGDRLADGLTAEDDGLEGLLAVAGADLRLYRERTTGFEPATPTLARLCSTS